MEIYKALTTRHSQSALVCGSACRTEGDLEIRLIFRQRSTPSRSWFILCRRFICPVSVNKGSHHGYYKLKSKQQPMVEAMISSVNINTIILQFHPRKNVATNLYTSQQSRKFPLIAPLDTSEHRTQSHFQRLVYALHLQWRHRQQCIHRGMTPIKIIDRLIMKPNLLIPSDYKAKLRWSINETIII